MPFGAPSMRHATNVSGRTRTQPLPQFRTAGTSRRKDQVHRIRELATLALIKPTHVIPQARPDDLVLGRGPQHFKSRSSFHRRRHCCPSSRSSMHAPRRSAAVEPLARNFVLVGKSLDKTRGTLDLGNCADALPAAPYVTPGLGTHLLFGKIH